MEVFNPSNTAQISSPSEMKGWLMKWTNYLRGYQKRWFVLANGKLTYYRNRVEVSHMCRGSISLYGASIHCEDSCVFVVSSSVGGSTASVDSHQPPHNPIGSQGFTQDPTLMTTTGITPASVQTFHLKAFTEVEKQQWVTALELAKSHVPGSCACIRHVSDTTPECGVTDTVCCEARRASADSWHVFEDDACVTGADMEPEDTLAPDSHATHAQLASRLHSIRTCYELLVKHGTYFNQLLSALDTVTTTPSTAETAETAQQQHTARTDSESGAPTELSAVSSVTGVSTTQGDTALLDVIRPLSERVSLFRITTRTLIKACTDYLSTAAAQEAEWRRALHQERGQRLHLQEMVEQLTRQQLERAQPTDCCGMAENYSTQHKQHHLLLQEPSADGSVVAAVDDSSVTAVSAISAVTARTTQLHSSSSSADGASGCGAAVDSDKEEEEEFVDAADYVVGCQSTAATGGGGSQHTATHTRATFPVAQFQSTASRTQDDTDSSTDPETGQTSDSTRILNRYNCSHEQPQQIGRSRRLFIPDKPCYSLSLWSIMKNCIGKDLSKIPLPVNFSEPLSMLQRLTEDLEYSHLLDSAALCEHATEQMCYVAAFTVSSYSSTAVRCAKPFNPLLGETYECDRSDDLGWRAFSEQVSHHPPMLAQHCTGRGWTCFQEFTMSSKFRGKYLQVIPLGIAHIHFDRSGNHYTWRKVTTTVHNIIVGKLWVDQHGEMTITNHTTGDLCNIKYVPYSYFSKDVHRKVTGTVQTRDESVAWLLMGNWDTHIECARVLSTNTLGRGKSVYETDHNRLLWTCHPLRDDAEKCYHFSNFAVQLNEYEEGVAPTDSRRRPDQRLMEEGDWNGANEEKLRLEEKQRSARKVREQEAEQMALRGADCPEYKPTWFSRQQERYTRQPMYLYDGGYWECKQTQDWSRCPDIF